MFDLLQLNLDWQKNSKTKVEKAFFFIFKSSYAEMSFLGPKKSQNGATYLCSFVLSKVRAKKTVFENKFQVT
jgi:hypothetical protein